VFLRGWRRGHQALNTAVRHIRQTREGTGLHDVSRCFLVLVANRRKLSMSRTASTIIATVLIAAATFASADATSANSSRHSPQHSKQRSLHSAPVYLDQRPRRPLKWGDPGFYDGWVPPPAHAGGVG
jgi:hypothetical protein